MSDKDIPFKILLFGGLSLHLFITLFTRTVAMIFVLNFGGGGLNATVVLFFATMSGVLYALLYSRFYPHKSNFMIIILVIAGLSSLLSLYPNPIISLIAVVVFQLVFIPALIMSLQKLKKDFAYSALVGILIGVFTTAVLNFASVYATLLGNLIHGIYTLSWIILGIQLVRSEALISSPEEKISNISPLIGFIFIQMALIGSISTLSSWFLSSEILVTTLILVSLLVTGYLLENKSLDIGKIRQLSLIIGYIITLGVLIWFDNLPAYLVSILLIQIFAIFTFRIGIKVDGSPSITRLGIKLGLMQFLIIIIAFLQIGTPYWTAFPLPTSVLKGNAELFMYILGLILPISAIKAMLQEGKP